MSSPNTLAHLLGLKQKSVTAWKALLLSCSMSGILAFTLQAAPVPPTDNTSAPYMTLYGWGIGSSGIAHGDYTAAWLNRSGLWTEDFCAYSGTSQSLAWTNLAMPGVSTAGAAAWLRQNPNGMLVLTMGMFPNGYTPADNYASCISGTYSTSWYKKAAQNLVGYGLTSGTSGTSNHVILRLGHEFNGGWYPWHVNHKNTDLDGNGNKYDDRPENYVALFQKMVTTMRAVAPNLKFCWNGTNVWTPYPISDAYPGDTYVDYVGTDAYDVSYAANSYPYTTGTYPYGSDGLTRQQNAWNNWIYPASPQNGIQAWQNIAIAHSKPFSIPEWGTCDKTTNGGDGTGGLDNTYYIQQMYNLIQTSTNNVAFHCYFDVQAPDGYHQLTALPNGTTEFPHAAALFQQLFGVPPYPTDTDIGTVGISGSSNPVTIYGAGGGYLTGGTSDNFHFSAKPFTGSGLTVAQITSMSSGTAPQSGLMLRQSTAANSAYAALYVCNGQYVFQSRTSAGTAATKNFALSSGTTPVYLKLMYQGSFVSGYESSDGVNWTFAGSQNLTLTGTSYLGVAVSSGSTTGINATSVNNVDNVNIPTSLTTSIANAVVLDNTNSVGVTITGTWTTRTNPSGFYGTNFIDDANRNKGSCSVKFSPTVPASGQYDVYATWTGWFDANLSGYDVHADNVPISIISASGTSTVTANQCVGTNLWNYLGTYSFNSGTSGNIIVSNAGTDGYTLADAVMLVPVPALTAPIADAYVRDGTYASTNFGTATDIEVKLDASGFSRNTYMKFNVAGMANITSANLQLYPLTVGTDPAVTYTVEYVSDDSWTETGITWNNKPAGSGTVLGTLSGTNIHANVPVTLDITSQVKSEAAGDGVLSIRIYSNNSGSQKLVTFGSREQTTPGNQPQLLIH